MVAVLSASNYNAETGQCWIAHVVDAGSPYPSYVQFQDKRILVDMIQTINWRSRKASITGRVEDDTLAKIRAVIWAIALR